MMKSKSALAIALLCAVWLLMSAPAQTPSTPAPAAAAQAQASQSPAPAIKVTTHLVQVNVVVHGKKNEPVTDLTKADFHLTDAGQPQEIATCAMESSAPDPKAQKAKLVLPPNTFTNRTLDMRPTAPKGVTVILFDGLNTKFEDQAQAKRHLVNFLKEMKPEDSVALYALGTNLKILHDFTH